MVNRVTRLLYVAVAWSCMWAPTALADDFFGTVETRSETRDTTDVDSPWQYRGWLQQKIGYGYRAPAVNVNRGRADLTRVETQFYNQINWGSGPWRVQLAGSLVHDWLPDMERAGLWNGYNFSEQEYNQRRWRIDLSDTYISWQDGDWWLKAGYQTLAWGEAESLKVTDVLARRDQRWPGQDDLENLRLPVPAISLTWNNQLDIVVLAETLPDRQSAAYAEFDPYINLRSGNSATDPALNFSQDKNPGIALRWRQSWQGLDAQFMLADIAGYEYLPQSITLQQEAAPEIHLQPARQQVAGFGLQMTRGTWLLRTEQAWHKDAQTLASNPEDLSHKTDQWRSMLGADYTGINNLTLTGELSWIYSDQTENNQSHWQESASARANYTLYNERLTLSATAIYLPGGEGNVIRLGGEWEFSDQLSAKLEVIDYSAKNQNDILYPYRHNDTLLLTLRLRL